MSLRPTDTARPSASRVLPTGYCTLYRRPSRLSCHITRKLAGVGVDVGEELVSGCGRLDGHRMLHVAPLLTELTRTPATGRPGRPGGEYERLAGPRRCRVDRVVGEPDAGELPALVGRDPGLQRHPVEHEIGGHRNAPSPQSRVESNGMYGVMLLISRAVGTIAPPSVERTNPSPSTGFRF